MLGKYILDAAGRPMAEPSLLRWVAWVEVSDRKVAEDKIGDCRISTVFLSIDHNFDPKGPPILWETMVFGGPLDQEQRRCSGSREQAEAVHADMVALVKAALSHGPHRG